MKFKKISLFGFALLLSLSSLMVIRVDRAFAAVKTWDGGGPDNNFNTGANWSGDTAPTNGDALVFDQSIAVNYGEDLTNDLSSLSVASITFSGTNANYYSFDLIGNAITVTGGITNSSSLTGTLNLNVTLGGNQTFDIGSGGGGLNFGDSTNAGSKTLALSTYSLTLSGSSACGALQIFSQLTGSGSITSSANVIGLNADSPSYTGAITINNGAAFANTSQALGATSSGTTVASGAKLNLGFSSDTTFAEPLTLSGTGESESGAVTTSDPYTGAGCTGGGGPSTTYTATLSGSITLQANTTVGPSSMRNLAITGPLSGSYTITVAPGANGTLTINSSNNTSLTPNGSLEAPVVSTTYADNSPSTYISVGKNQTAIVTGTYGGVTVSSGGTLKGTGTVADVYVDSGGAIAPGLSPGCLNTGNLTEGGTYSVEIGGATACGGYDQIKVTGTVDLTGGTLSTSLYNNYKPKAGEKYTIIDNDGTDAITGTFNNLTEGATFSVSGYVLKISYVGGTGNDVVLSVISVPSTGFGLILNNPIYTALVTLGSAVALAVLARRARKVWAR